jgi:hypothetical protein
MIETHQARKKELMAKDAQHHFSYALEKGLTENERKADKKL